MKIIDIIVRSFYDIARRGKGIRKLDTAITATNFFFTFNEESLFNYFAGSYISNGKISIFYTDSSIPLIMLEVISGGILDALHQAVVQCAPQVIALLPRHVADVT